MNINVIFKYSEITDKKFSELAETVTFNTPSMAALQMAMDSKRFNLSLAWGVPVNSIACIKLAPQDKDYKRLRVGVDSKFKKEWEEQLEQWGLYYALHYYSDKSVRWLVFAEDTEQVDKIRSLVYVKSVESSNKPRLLNI